MTREALWSGEDMFGVTLASPGGAGRPDCLLILYRYAPVYAYMPTALSSLVPGLTRRSPAQLPATAAVVVSTQVILKRKLQLLKTQYIMSKHRRKEWCGPLTQEPVHREQPVT